MRLDGVLRALGMTDAFDPDSADFTGMGRSDTGRLYINTVMHSTYIELDAHGTRAAAVSIVGGGDGADAPMETRSVILDRPYLYMIVDTEYGLPAFHRHGDRRAAVKAPGRQKAGRNFPSGFGFCLKSHAYGGTSAGLALERDLGAVVLGGVLYYGEAEAVPPVSRLWLLSTR